MDSPSLQSMGSSIFYLYKPEHSVLCAIPACEILGFLSPQIETTRRRIATIDRSFVLRLFPLLLVYRKQGGSLFSL